MIPKGSYLIIQNVTPQLDGGRYAIKRKEGDSVKVSAEVFREGHDVLRAELLWRKEGSKSWSRIPMEHVNAGLDLWEASFLPKEIGMHEYKIFAYTDHFASWLHDTKRKYEAGATLESESIEGLHLMKDAAARAPKKVATQIKEWICEIEELEYPREQAAVMFSEQVDATVCSVPLRKGVETGESQVYQLYVDRKKATFASWYEVFPRSTGTDPNNSATWRDVENFLPYVADLGFDVLYFPPIHPIGKSFKKGRNNSLLATEDDPGCPYAIGNENGGHFDVCERLGTMADFERVVKKAGEMGIDIAIDFAINCSYDHPYLKEHPDWFFRRPDGTIKYAENPPKKYEDIYPLNFDCDDRDALWNEMKRYFLFWAEKGVRIFRVDNPHTKPVIFWEWVIREVQKVYPDSIFLAEAFTRPRMMEMLGKAGFTQSYTYFTWRSTKKDLTEYFSYLTEEKVVDYMRGNLFPTTPDIHPTYLHHAPPAAFKIRLALATTLSSIFGMYSGYEFCENEPFPGKEELNFSEKYEFKVRDWEQPGIRDFVRELNRARHANPALQEYDNLNFCQCENDQIIAYVKSARDSQNVIIMVISLDAYQKQISNVTIPLEACGLTPDEEYGV
ncbi:MAG: alpha-1,4-glucan--maltose-1-phosphate maltosyltransferase, partial [Kiritimatiellaceae bacterium]|nr:alpha-1,4-glucan--maltose-1-phosphate maltosyltransferase [Kiritimatiellaceae bacterium]